MNIIFALGANCYGLLTSAEVYNCIGQCIAPELSFPCACLYYAICLIPVLLSLCLSLYSSAY